MDYHQDTSDTKLENPAKQKPTRHSVTWHDNVKL